MEGTNLILGSCGTCIDALEVFGLPWKGDYMQLYSYFFSTNFQKQKTNRVHSSSCSFPIHTYIFFPFFIFVSHVYTEVPDGVFALKYRSGALVGELSPGFHLLGPLEQVKFCITKQDTMMDIPIQDCPTKDNAMVRIDIFLMFRIVDPKRFISELSPHKLTDLLRSAQEEAVRTLARKIYLADIYDLVQFDESEIVEDISAKFSRYGVKITQVMITEVKCRDEIKERLQRETILKREQELQSRKQEFDMLKVKEQDDIGHARLENEIKREKLIEGYKKRFLEVEKIIAETHQRTIKRLAEVKTSQERIVGKIREQAEKFCAEVDEKTTALLLGMQSEAKSSVTLLKAQQSSYKTETMSKTDLEVRKCRSEMVQVLGASEEVAARKLTAKRRFETELAKLSVLDNLAQNSGNVVISGNSNGNLVSEMISTNLEKRLYVKN